MELFRALEEIFTQIENSFDPIYVFSIAQRPYSMLNHYQKSFGAWIERPYLTPDSDLLKLFVERNVVCIKDMSAYVLRSFYIYIHEKYKRYTVSTYFHL